MIEQVPLPQELLPQSRRRSYSDSARPGFRNGFRRLISPPPQHSSMWPPFTPLTTIEAKVPLKTPPSEHSYLTPSSTPPDNLTPDTPSSRGTLCRSVTSDLPQGRPIPGRNIPAKVTAPIAIAGTSPVSGSPPHSRYAGMVVGSPLGSGPLNGTHLPSLELGIDSNADSNLGKLSLCSSFSLSTFIFFGIWWIQCKRCVIFNF